jgi:hypothetical protein
MPTRAETIYTEYSWNKALLQLKKIHVIEMNGGVRNDPAFY